MSSYIFEKARKFLQDQKKKKIWYRLTTSMAALVVFITTYMLILPAITMEKELVCKMEEHVHSDSCYRTQTKKVLTCDYDTLKVHTHTKECEDENGSLICMKADYLVHTHDAYCYDANGNLICTLPEIKEHKHEESCYAQPTLVCGLVEQEGHVHGDSCYYTEEVLVCSNGTSVGGGELVIDEEGGETAHVHTADCWQTNLVLGCTIPESAGHYHSDACYAGGDTLICGYDKWEIKSHQHNENCFTEVSEQTNELICEQVEHTHTDNCYEVKKEEKQDPQEVPELTTEFNGDSGEIDVDTESESNMQTDLDEADSTANEADQDGTENKSEPVTETVTVLAGFGAQANAVTLASDGTNADTDGETNTGDSSESSTNDESSSDEMVQVLTCTNNEENHEHNENCYISIQKSQLTCGKEVHEHGENCYDAGNNLICTVEAHTHTSECYNSGNDGSTEESTEPETQESEEPETQETIERVDLTTSKDITDISVAWHENEWGTVTQQLYYQEKFYTVLSFKVAAASDNAGETKYYEVTLDSSMTGVEIKNSSNCTAALSEDGTKLLIDVPSLADAADCSVKLSAYAAGEAKVVFLNSEIPVTYKSLENASNYRDVKWMDASGTQVYSVCNGETYTVQAAFGIGADAFASAGIRTYSVIIDSAITDLEVTSATDGCEISSITENEDGTHTVILTVNGDTDGDEMYAQVDGILNISGKIDKQENQTQITLLGSSVPVSEKYTFTYNDESGLTAELSVVGGNYTPEEYELEVEKKDSDGYQTAISNFLENEKQNAEEAYIYRVSLKNKSDRTEVSNINCSSYQLSMTWENGLYQKIYSSDTLTSAYAQNNGGNLSKMENGSFTLNDSGNVTGFSINRSGGLSSSDEYAFIRSTSEMLSYNEVKDAFITDPAYSKYYNSNSPIGTAGSFHLVAFDTANLSSHTNGNILAHTLKAGSNFGTNGYADELSYIQYYEKINGDSASDMDHVLVLGDSNEITVVDNGNHLAVNGTQINKPQNIVQDVDTANAPFIDLNRVKNEIQQISSNMASYNEAGLTYTSGAESGDEKNVLKLNNPNGVGVINLKASELNNKFGNYVQIDGFSSDCNGAVVINVDCTGMTNITMSEKALVVVDGEEQGTSEVVEFSNGKVIWNFVNAEGVTIEAHQMTGMIVAPGATVNIHKNLNGTVVADNINVMAESHRTDFTGKVTEPGDDEYYVTIKKIQTGYAGITLSGAEFDLYQYSENEWRKVNEEPLVTDAKGVIALKDLKTDMAYKLVETKAPEGYVLKDDSSYVFWIPSSSEKQQPEAYPVDFSGDAIDIDETLLIANDKDTRTTTISLFIEKKWLDVKGESLSDVPVSRIAVNIYRSVDGSEDKSLYKTVYLTSMLGWKTTISDLPEIVINNDGTTTKYVYTVEEVAVDGYRSTFETSSVVAADTEETVVTETTVTLVNQQEAVYTFTKVDSANTGLKLPGAVFTVYKAADGTPVKEYMTDDNGVFKISLADIDENGNAVYEENTAYYFIETEAPSGYVLPSKENLTKYYFYFSSEGSTGAPPECGENAVNLSVTNGTAIGTNERQENTYEFTKVSKGTGTALPGAEFSVYKRVVTGDVNTDTLVKTYTSGEDGKFSISWKDGVYETDTLYYVKETKAPAGYILDEETQHFFYFSSSADVAPEGADEKAIDLTTTPGIVSWENEKKPNSYTFTKEDGFNSEIKLSGAKFQVFDAEGNAIKDSNEAYLVYSTDENGTFSINHTEEAFEYAYDTLYYIKEVEAPEGYVLSENPELYYFYFSKESQDVPGNVDVTAVDLSVTEGSVVYKNDKEAHNYTFTKTDSVETTTLLPGAEFTVYKYAKNSSNQFTEVAVTKYTTDTKGQFVISWTNGGDQNYKYEYDTGYYVVETKAPVQYELPESPKKYYFYFSSPGTTSVPEGLDESAVNLSKTDGEMTCVNEKAVTDISVKKEWVNGTGESVNVQLYSSTTPPEAQTVVTDGTTYLTINVKVTEWLNADGTQASAPSGGWIWVNIVPCDAAGNLVWEDTVNLGNMPIPEWSTSSDGLVGTITTDGATEVKYYKAQFGAGGKYNTVASLRLAGESTETDLSGIISGENTEVTIELTGILYDTSSSAAAATLSLNDDSSEAEGIITNLLLPDNAAAVGESVTLGSDNNWQYTWDNLPEYDTNGNKLYYYVKETSTGSYSTNYTYEYIDSNDWTQGIKLVTITNTSTVPETTNFTVYKEWEGYTTDVTDTYEVVVQLTQNGTAYGDTVVLDAGSDWTYTWSGLPTGYTYSVEEIAVRDKDSDKVISDSNYTKESEANPDGSVTITNTSNTGGYQLPETGGPGTQVFTWGGAVITAFAAILMYIKNKRRKEGHRTS